MNDKPDIRNVSVYLVLGRAHWRWDPPVVKAMRKQKPALKSGEVAIKVKLKVPMALFEQFIPELDLDVEEQQIIAPRAEIEDA